MQVLEKLYRCNGGGGRGADVQRGWPAAGGESSETTRGRFRYVRLGLRASTGSKTD
jgi:hypothetical protein